MGNARVNAKLVFLGIHPVRPSVGSPVPVPPSQVDWHSNSGDRERPALPSFCRTACATRSGSPLKLTLRAKVASKVGESHHKKGNVFDRISQEDVRYLKSQGFSQEQITEYYDIGKTTERMIAAGHKQWPW
jgi:hypothetical protein